MELKIIILFVIIIYLLIQLNRKSKRVTVYEDRPYINRSFDPYINRSFNPYFNPYFDPYFNTYIDPYFLWFYSWIPFYNRRNNYYSTYRPKRHHKRKNHKYKHPQRPVNTYKPVKKGRIILKKIKKV